MRILLALALLLFAGCTTPGPATTPDGPPSLDGQRGLLFLDATAGRYERLSEDAIGAWLSPGGSIAVWSEGSYHVVAPRGGERAIVPAARWAQVYDNGTGLEIMSGEARVRSLLSDDVLWRRGIPPPPRQGTTWQAASDDLSVLAVEYPGEVACRGAITIAVSTPLLAGGCHLSVARDGRVGWTEGAIARVRHTNGTIENVTAPQDARAENPVFTDAGFAYLRIDAQGRTELVLRGETERVVAQAKAPTRLALHGASADGTYVLVTAFGG